MGEAGQLRNHCLEQDQARPRNCENPVMFQWGLQRGLGLGVLLGCRRSEGAQRKLLQVASPGKAKRRPGKAKQRPWKAKRRLGKAKQRPWKAMRRTGKAKRL
jgi:hypothetical protein